MHSLCISLFLVFFGVGGGGGGSLKGPITDVISYVFFRLSIIGYEKGTCTVKMINALKKLQQ